MNPRWNFDLKKKKNQKNLLRCKKKKPVIDNNYNIVCYSVKKNILRYHLVFT